MLCVWCVACAVCTAIEPLPVRQGLDSSCRRSGGTSLLLKTPLEHRVAGIVGTTVLTKDKTYVDSQ